MCWHSRIIGAVRATGDVVSSRGSARLPRSNLALLLTAASRIVALFATLTGHNLLKAAAIERER